MIDFAQLASARADLAKRKAQALEPFEAEEADLDATERVLRRISAEPSRAAALIAQVGHIHAKAEGIPPQYAAVLAAIDERNGNITRQALRAQLNISRSTPITDGAFFALLSKMRGEHIETEGEIVRRKRKGTQI